MPFFEALLDDEVFVSGDYTTGFVAERLGVLEIEGSKVGEPGELPEKESRQVEVEVNGKLFRVRVYSDEKTEAGKPRRKGGRAHRASATEGAVVAPMQGTIVKVLVEEGQEVAADEPVCVLEAMKMESEIRAPKDGVVSEVFVQSGQSVRSGDNLVLLD